MKINVAAVRADNTLETYQAANGIEGDQNTVAMHLLGDIVEWCETRNMDFDALLKDTSEMLREANL